MNNADEKPIENDGPKTSPIVPRPAFQTVLPSELAAGPIIELSDDWGDEEADRIAINSILDVERQNLETVTAGVYNAIADDIVELNSILAEITQTLHDEIGGAIAVETKTLDKIGAAVNRELVGHIEALTMEAGRAGICNEDGSVCTPRDWSKIVTPIVTVTAPPRKDVPTVPADGCKLSKDEYDACFDPNNECPIDPYTEAGTAQMEACCEKFEPEICRPALPAGGTQTTRPTAKGDTANVGGATTTIKTGPGIITKTGTGDDTGAGTGGQIGNTSSTGPIVITAGDGSPIGPDGCPQVIVTPTLTIRCDEDGVTAESILSSGIDGSEIVTLTTGFGLDELRGCVGLGGDGTDTTTTGGKCAGGAITIGDDSFAVCLPAPGTSQTDYEGPVYCFPAACDKLASSIDEAFTQTTDELWDQITDTVTGGLTGANSSITDQGVLMRSFTGLFAWVWVVAFAVLKGFGGLANRLSSFLKSCTNERFTSIAGRRMMLGFIDKYIMTLPPQMYAPTDYALNYSCPTLVPTVNEANALSARNFIDDCQWEALVKLNGRCPEWQKPIEDSMRVRLNIREAITANRRGYINDGQLQTLLERNGVKDEEQQDVMCRLSTQWPPMQDLIRFMVRDIFDPAIVEQYELATDFDKKWTDEAKRYGKGVGMDEEIARLYWLAHWRMPPPTQLYTMLHRLRPGRGRTDADGNEVVVTKADVQKAIEIDDVMPKWARALTAVAFNPLGRIDIKRTYSAGATKYDDLVNLYQDLGYDEETSKKLRDFTVLDTADMRAKLQGKISRTDAIKLFVDDIINDGELSDLLNDLSIPFQMIEEIKWGAEIKRTARRRKDAIKFVRSAFIRFNIDRAEAQNQLFANRVPPENVTELIDLWEMELKTKYKKSSAAALCRQYQRRIISPVQYVASMMRLGYNADDAQAIAGVCISLDAERLAKQREQALKDEAARIEKLQKKQEQIAKNNRPCRDAPKPLCPVRTGT